MMLQDIDIRFDRPRQMAYHVIVYFLCRLVLTGSDSFLRYRSSSALGEAHSP